VPGGAPCRTSGTTCIGDRCLVPPGEPCTGPSTCGGGETCCSHFKRGVSWCAGICNRQVVCHVDADCPIPAPGNPVYRGKCEPTWYGPVLLECH
jgi:hypothetical protein